MYTTAENVMRKTLTKFLTSRMALAVHILGYNLMRRITWFDVDKIFKLEQMRIASF